MFHLGQVRNSLWFSFGHEKNLLGKGEDEWFEVLYSERLNACLSLCYWRPNIGRKTTVDTRWLSRTRSWRSSSGPRRAGCKFTLAEVWPKVFVFVGFSQVKCEGRAVGLTDSVFVSCPTRACRSVRQLQAVLSLRPRAWRKSLSLCSTCACIVTDSAAHSLEAAPRKSTRMSSSAVSRRPGRLTTALQGEVERLGQRLGIE